MTTLVTLFALIVPLVGTAQAAPSEPFTITINPTTDSASVGTCNDYTVHVQGANGQPVTGQSVTVRITQDTPPGGNLAIGFCSPTPPAGSNFTPVTPNNVTVTPGNTTTACGTPPAAPPAPANLSCHNNTAPPVGNTTFTTTVSGEGNFGPANGSGPDANGNLFFGVASTQPGTMAIQARITEPTSGTVRIVNATKTWVAGGGANAKTIACTWDTGPGAGTASNSAQSNDPNNPETFTCVVKDASGNRIGGADVRYVITSGPDQTPTANASIDCGPTSPATNGNGSGGTATCSLNHDTTGGPSGVGQPGTDTVLAYVELGCANPPAGTTGCNPTGPDSFEPQTTLTKVYYGPARNVACTPASATNQTGQSHTVTCTVTDVNGAPVNNAVVTFTLSGLSSARFTTLACFQGNNNAQSCQIATNASGVVVISFTSDNPGTATLTADISNQAAVAGVGGGFQATNQGGTPECSRIAGNPSGSTAGNCSTQVTKTFTTGTPTASPTVHQRTITIDTLNKSCIKRGHRRHHHRGRCKAWTVHIGGTLTADPALAGCVNGVDVSVLGPESKGKQVTTVNGTWQTTFRFVRPDKPRGTYTAGVNEEPSNGTSDTNQVCSAATTSRSL